MERQNIEDNFVASLAVEFGEADWTDRAYEASHDCPRVQNGGRKICPTTGIRCKNVGGCESAIQTRNLNSYHGDTSMGE